MFRYRRFVSSHSHPVKIFCGTPPLVPAFTYCFACFICIVKGKAIIPKKIIYALVISLALFLNLACHEIAMFFLRGALSTT